jgi:hypothetical protein
MTAPVLVFNSQTTKVEETDDNIVITVRKDGNEGLSDSGKTFINGSTHGAVMTPSGIQVSVNAYTKNPQYVKGQ